MLLISILSLLAILLLPDVAQAWGPATHLELGHTIISNVEMLVEPIQSLLRAYPQDFLYGNISADIVVGKNLVRELKHCHNWSFGFRLLRKADSDSQRAFAYGYLAHLGADTVAHNHFIPEMMVRSFSARTLRHIYWELRFDALADKRVWALPRKIARNIHRDNDRLLRSLIEEAPLSFRTNKTIFSSMLSIQRVEQWHRMLDHLSSRSRWKLPPEVKDRYFSSALDAVLSVLIKGTKAQCVKKDPVGRDNLESAKLLRKKLKARLRQGRDWEDALKTALTRIKL
jgi:hypothetical protein